MSQNHHHHHVLSILEQRSSINFIGPAYPQCPSLKLLQPKGNSLFSCFYLKFQGCVVYLLCTTPLPCSLVLVTFIPCAQIFAYIFFIFIFYGSTSVVLRCENSCESHGCFSLCCLKEVSLI